MREILFRGKKESTGEWVYGDLRHYRSGKVGIHNNELRYTMLVDPETVGQYTGLKDKNGKRIFEGDVVRIEDDIPMSPFCDGMVGKVEYSECGYFVVPKDLMETAGLFNECSVIEVIGNIHDNPEMLEEGGEE